MLTNIKRPISSGLGGWRSHRQTGLGNGSLGLFADVFKHFAETLFLGRAVNGLIYPTE